MRLVRLSALSVLAAVPAAAIAAEPPIAELERRLSAQAEEIAELRRQIEAQGDLIRQLAGPRDAPPAATVAPPPIPAMAAPAPAPSNGGKASALTVSGDLRVREEFNTGQDGVRDRTRTAIRARLRARYALSPSLSLGAGIATGDPDDPNSTDITLGGFDDDLEVSLDQAWLHYARAGLSLQAGKFAQIFARTDMVWDGDVTPQGLGAVYTLPIAQGATLDGRALYFIVDESAGGRDSDMIGGQAVLQVPLDGWMLSLAGAYYHHRLGSLAGADAGDFRDNLLSGGRYLSDFRLGDVIGSLSYSGLGARWPIALTADYVRNFGAAVPADSGFNVELALGRASAPGDFRIAYNRSDVEVDAVLAAFSHDNIALGSNYRLHGLALDYVPVGHVLLNASFYHYRPLDALYAPVGGRDWRDRLRLSVMLSF